MREIRIDTRLKSGYIRCNERKGTNMRYLGLNVETQTKTTLRVNNLYIENIEDGYPVTTHVHAYYDLRWGAYTLTDWHAEMCDNIGKLLLKN